MSALEYNKEHFCFIDAIQGQMTKHCIMLQLVAKNNVQGIALMPFTPSMMTYSDGLEAATGIESPLDRINKQIYRANPKKI